MGREIKFRAWDKKFNIMLAPEAFNRNDIWITGEGKVYEIEEWSGYSGGGKREIDCSEQYILMQYTGLKDIYEGDILDCLYPERGEHGDVFDYSNYKGVVVWDKSTYKFVLKCTLGNEYLEHLLRPSVIGNIYENPSLLEVTP
jgi:uncharacterized phage protein (TIGR01671 family)